MNSSKTNELLNDINDKTSYSNSSFDTLIAKNDFITSYLGRIEDDIEDTNALLTTIDSTLLTNTSLLADIKTNTNSGNSIISELQTQGDVLDNIKLDTSSVVNDISVSNEYNKNSYQSLLLKTNGFSSITSGDYSSANEYVSKQNTSGQNQYVKKLFIWLRTTNAMNTWNPASLFDISDTDGLLKIGISTTNDNIDTQSFNWNNNVNLTQYYKTSNTFSTQTAYAWEIDNLNIIIPDNQYLIAEASWDSSTTSGHTSVSLGCIYEE